jgi:Cu2+-exporting ATPase
MKKIIIILFAISTAFFANASTSTSFKNEPAKEQKTNTKQQVKFYVSFHCADCVKRLDKNLPFVKGVVKYKADLATKSVVVTYNGEKISKNQLQSAIEKMNFIVTDTPEELAKKMGE